MFHFLILTEDLSHYSYQHLCTVSYLNIPDIQNSCFQTHFACTPSLHTVSMSKCCPFKKHIVQQLVGDWL